MFTNNFVNLRKMLFRADPYYGSGSFNVKLPNGQSFAIGAAGCTYSDVGGSMVWGRCQELPAVAGNATATGYGIYFGTGSTPATKDDYRLENPITSGLTITNPSSISEKNEADGIYSVEASFIVNNTSGAEVNIWELGVFTPVGKASTTSGCWAALMDRVVLDSPVIIPNGGTKMITYKLTFNRF